jgi:hypothetical protein
VAHTCSQSQNQRDGARAPAPAIIWRHTDH